MTSALPLARWEALSMRSGLKVPWARKTSSGFRFISPITSLATWETTPFNIYSSSTTAWRRRSWHSTWTKIKIQYRLKKKETCTDFDKGVSNDFSFLLGVGGHVQSLADAFAWRPVLLRNGKCCCSIVEGVSCVHHCRVTWKIKRSESPLPENNLEVDSTTGPRHNSPDTQGSRSLRPFSLIPSLVRASSTLRLSLFLMKPLSMWTAMTWSWFRALFRRAVHTVESTPPLSRTCGNDHRRRR